MLGGAIGITGGDCFVLNGFKRGTSNAFVFGWCEADEEDDWADDIVFFSKEDEKDRIGLATTTFRVVRGRRRRNSGIKSMAAVAEEEDEGDVVSFIFFFLLC